MRDIKFRAWDKKKLIFHYNAEMYGAFQPLFDDGEELEFVDFIEQKDRFILQQYTGLNDSNGKEIYTGDIVYLAGYGDYQVEWPFVQLYQSAWEDDIGEIKGNIYENPELLKT